MRTRLLRIAVWLSAVVCALCLYAWVRSYAPDNLAVRSHGGKLLVVFADGPFGAYNDRAKQTYRSSRQVWLDYNRMAQRRWEALGFAYAAADFANGSFRMIGVPFPVLVLLTAPAPVWWAWHARRQRRRNREGCCANCGYDLRETKGRCPECGTEVMPQTAMG